MKTFRRLMIVLAVIVAPLWAVAQTDAYSAEMNKMLQATDAKATMIQTIAQSWEAAHLPLTNYEEAATAVVNAIWPDLIKDYTAEYKKYFTLDDMKAINRFYETPTGAKFSKYTATMSAAIQTTIMQKYSGVIQSVISGYLKM